MLNDIVTKGSKDSWAALDDKWNFKGYNPDSILESLETRIRRRVDIGHSPEPSDLGPDINMTLAELA